MTLTFSQLLSHSWRTYLDNLKAIYKIYIWLLIPTLLIGLVENFGAEINTVPGIVVFVVAVIVTIVFLLLVSIAFMLQIRNVLHNKDDSVQDLLVQATPLFWPFVGTTIIQMILLVVAYLLLIIPGIILTIFWAFMRESVVFRNKTYMKALDYSFALVRKRWWRVLGILLGLGLITVGTNIILSMALAKLGLIGVIINLLVVFFLSGWIAIASIMLFFDLEKTAQVAPTEVPKILKPVKVMRKKPRKAAMKKTARRKTKLVGKRVGKPSRKPTPRKATKRRRRR